MRGITIEELNSEEEKPEIEVSIGIANWISTYKESSDLVEAVDKALYKAKNTEGQRIWKAF